MFIYCIENKINGKKYIGQTTKPIEKRFKEHIQKSKCERRQTIHNALRKYGEQNFSVSEIEYVESYQEALIREQYWIAQLNTKQNGYNETDGGEGSSGRVLSEKTKEIHRKNANLRYQSGFSEVISESIKNLHTQRGKAYWSEEGMKKCLENLMPPDYSGERLNSAESIAKRNKSLKESDKVGKYSRTDSTRKKLSESRKGKGTGQNNAMASEINREKVAASKIGRRKMYSPDKSKIKYVQPKDFQVFIDQGWQFANLPPEFILG